MLGPSSRVFPASSLLPTLSMAGRRVSPLGAMQRTASPPGRRTPAGTGSSTTAAGASGGGGDRGRPRGGGGGDGGGRWGDHDGAEGRPPRGAAALLFGVVSLALPCEAKESDELVGKLADLISPIAANLGFSGALGMATALAFKTIGRLVAVAVGLVFVLVQALAHYGVITVHWSATRDKVIALVDQDGDGESAQPCRAGEVQTAS